MKKKCVIFTGFILLIIGVFFAFRIYYYYKYIPNALKTKKEYYDSLKIDETITIKTATIEDYFEVNNIKIKNDFKDFQLTNKFLNDEYASGYKKENDNVFITLGKDRINIIETLTNSKEDKWVKKLLKEQNITNDLDLLLYTINNKNNKPNILNTKHEMQFYNLIYNISLELLPIAEKITLIEGDLTGLIIKPKNIEAITTYLFDGTNKYGITFWNTNYFTNDYIKELINTIIIEKNSKIKINEKEMKITHEDYDTLVNIFNNLNYEETICEKGYKYMVEIKDKKYIFNRTYNKIIYDNKCSKIEGENLLKLEKILDFVYSDNEMNNIENVKMKIKEGTLTNKSATIIIIDNNQKTYQYGEYYRLDIKENGIWKEMTQLGANYYNDIAYIVDKNNQLELTHNWKEVYGELPLGEYRIVKDTCVNNGCTELKYFSVEFTID